MVAIYLNGQGFSSLDPEGNHITDDSFYLLFNAHHEPIDFTIEWSSSWEKVLDTAQDGS